MAAFLKKNYYINNIYSDVYVCVFNHMPTQTKDNYLCFVQAPTHRNAYKSLMSSLFRFSRIFANWSHVSFFSAVSYAEAWGDGSTCDFL